MSFSFDSGRSYEPLMGRWSRLVAPRFVSWVGLAPGAFVLDVGCGTGALSEALLLGGAGRVVGVDPSASYVDYARSHVPDGVKASFEVGDAMRLRFPDNSFDGAFCGLVLNFIPDPALGIAEMRRVVRQGGPVGAYVWDYGEHMDLTDEFWEAAKVLDPSAHLADEGALFALCRPEALKSMFERCTLVDVMTSGIEQELVFRDFDDYWGPILGGQGPMGSYAARLSEDERSGLKNELQKRLHAGPDGRIHLSARAWAVKGRKPTDHG